MIGPAFSPDSTEFEIEIEIELNPTRFPVESHGAVPAARQPRRVGPPIVAPPVYAPAARQPSGQNAGDCRATGIFAGPATSAAMRGHACRAAGAAGRVPARRARNCGVIHFHFQFQIPNSEFRI
jgi:hypothetical protein